ncbi:hypothetical protein OAK15_03665 [Verrucomicrobia bacterium]|nr:hypothetical protein [Verrucomicrobiota bacterium]
MAVQNTEEMSWGIIELSGIVFLFLLFCIAFATLSWFKLKSHNPNLTAGEFRRIMWKVLMTPFTPPGGND